MPWLAYLGRMRLRLMRCTDRGTVLPHERILCPVGLPFSSWVCKITRNALGTGVDTQLVASGYPRPACRIVLSDREDFCKDSGVLHAISIISVW